MLTIGEIKAHAVVFRSPFNPTHFYVCGRDEMDFVEFRERYASGDCDAKRATPVNFGDSWERFFMVYVEDCFDPPIAIVRAENECAAEEIFADELTWAHIGEPDLSDYDADSLHYNSSGIPYESESVRVVECQLHSVENFA